MEALWRANCTIPEREPLKDIIHIDAAVVGAGLAGILTAYFLMNKGLNVVVLERGRIGQGETGRTTAKITAQHGLIYDSIMKEYGEDFAWQYAMANSRAVSQYQTLIEKMKIDCSFKRCPSYVYNRENTDNLEKEAEAAVRLGIRSLMTDHTELPFPVKGALCFTDQARFHPLKFLSAVASNLNIYENTRVRTIENGIVYFDGGRLKADHVVIATHYPIINFPGYYFTRMHQSRSYVQALTNVPELLGMYLDEKENGLSFRSEGDTLLLGGIGHRTGKSEAANYDTLGYYDKLRRTARQLYPNASFGDSWSAQDCMTSDGIPYIGRYSSSAPRLFVATGFNKWGMTSSMVAATLLADRITGVRNECAPVFSPRRFSAKSVAVNVVNDGLQSAIGLASEAFHFPTKTLSNLKRGQGGLVEYKGKKFGAYKSEDGKTYLVSTRCPHLGCELKWNPDEKSWDCPCHGSRFDIHGKWLSSPAVNNLRKHCFESNKFPETKE